MKSTTSSNYLTDIHVNELINELLFDILLTSIDVSYTSQQIW